MNHPPMDAGADDEALREVLALGKELRNWGRWGADDERGTVNFITPSKIVEAGARIRQGRVISLALNIEEPSPLDVASAGRFNPIHKMTRYRGDNAFGTYWGPFRSSDDMIIMGLQSSTQWDSLAHLWYDGQLYNGFSADTVTAGGASRCGMRNWVRGVVGRGVLLDVARHKGVDALDRFYAITPDELDATAKAQNVRIQSGDIVLIRTGAITRWRVDHQAIGRDSPGLLFDCARWLHHHEVAAVCADNVAVEVTTQPRGLPTMAFHMVALRDMGLLLGEMYDLDELAVDCAQDGVYEFFFTAAPLNIPTAVGSPINPLAIK